MQYRVSIKNSLISLGLFLLTIGNNKFINDHYGSLVEYIGLIIILFKIVWESKNTKTLYKRFPLVLCLMALLSVGALISGLARSTKLGLIATSIALIVLSTLSDSLLSSNRKIRSAAKAIISGCIMSGIIGILTKTFGIIWDPEDAIIGFQSLNGFQHKNYCAGIWLSAYILYYVYLLREHKLNSRKARLKLFGILIFILLSGSKGILVLWIAFMLCINFDKILLIRKRQRKLVLLLLIVIAVGAGLYIYNNILHNIVTYAYRMEGLTAVIKYLSSNPKRLLTGMSDIAYANTGLGYTYNMRNFLGWQASVEMAYVNILIKNGLLGIFAYGIIFTRYFKRIPKENKENAKITTTLIIVMLLSGMTETFIASIHYVFGPVLYCLVNSSIRHQNLPVSINIRSNENGIKSSNIRCDNNI